MTFKTSKLKILLYLLISMGFTAGCWYGLFETDDLIGFERYVIYAGLILFGFGSLAFLPDLLSKTKVIEITENGFTYSVYPNQFIQWNDIEAIVPIALPHMIEFRFKTKHHAVLYQQAAKGWFSSKEPKQALRMTLSMFTDYKEMPSAFLHGFSGEIQEKVEDELKEIYRQKIDDIAVQRNIDPDVVRAFLEQPGAANDPDDDGGDVLAGLDDFVKRQSEMTAPVKPALPAVEGEEWWQTASREFGERVAAHSREKQRASGKN